MEIKECVMYELCIKRYIQSPMLKFAIKFLEHQYYEVALISCWCYDWFINFVMCLLRMYSSRTLTTPGTSFLNFSSKVVNFFLNFRGKNQSISLWWYGWSWCSNNARLCTSTGGAVTLGGGGGWVSINGNLFSHC